MWWRRVRYVLVLLALSAIATCPAAKRACVAKNRAREADDLLTVLADRVERTVLETGKVPPVAAGPSPAQSCCDQGGTCSPDAATWDTPGWRALAFSVDGPYRYRYQYTPDPSGTSAVLRAVGDLDCDGDRSLYELTLKVEAGHVRRAWKRLAPYE